MAAAKPDSAPAAAAPAAGAKGDATAAPAPAQASAASAWLPVIAVVLLAPVATWATVEFLVFPRLQKKMSAPAAGEAPAAAEAPASHGSHGGGKEGKGGKESGPGYEFQNVVVNLSGTMGTRYLKTTFLVTGVDATIKGVFEAAKPRLTDVALNVLSSLTLADLEEPGAKNVIREKLVSAFNQALGKKVADQVYFSDFVIQ
jgi:flagellar FliL protein